MPNFFILNIDLFKKLYNYFPVNRSKTKLSKIKLLDQINEAPENCGLKFVKAFLGPTVDSVYKLAAGQVAKSKSEANQFVGITQCKAYDFKPAEEVVGQPDEFREVPVSVTQSTEARGAI